MRTDLFLVYAPLAIVFASFCLVAPARGQVVVDVVAQRSACEVAAATPSTARAARLAELAQRQRAAFDRANGRRARESDQYVLQDDAPGDGPGISVGAALAWQKVYRYYEVAGVENSIAVAYGPGNNGDGNETLEINAREYRRLIDQAFPGPGANAATRQQLEAPLQQILSRDVPWSAAFISSLIAQEFEPQEATRAVGHWSYIESAVMALAAGNTQYAYLACDPAWVAPRVGDIVCNHRDRGLRSYDAVVLHAQENHARRASQRGGYSSHCDIVVETHYEATRPDVLTIGGNVGDSVSPTTYRVNPDQRLIPRTDDVPLIAILVLRAPD